VPIRNASPVHIPTFDATIAAPTTVLKRVTGRYARITARTIPTIAIARSKGIWTVQASLVIRIGAVRNAAIIFIGCAASVRKMCFSLLFSLEASSTIDSRADTITDLLEFAILLSHSNRLDSVSVVHERYTPPMGITKIQGQIGEIMTAQGEYKALMEKQIKYHRQMIVMALVFGLLAGASYWHRYGYLVGATVEEVIEPPDSTA
jgi:hypothetical protein